MVSEKALINIDITIDAQTGRDLFNALYQIELRQGRVIGNAIEMGVKLHVRPLSWWQQIWRVYRILRRKHNVVIAGLVTYHWVKFARERKPDW